MTGYLTYADLRDENVTLESRAALSRMVGDADRRRQGRRTRRWCAGHVAVLPDCRPHAGDWPRFRASRGSPCGQRRGDHQRLVVAAALRCGSEHGGPADHGESADRHARGRAPAEYRRPHCRASKSWHRDLDAAWATRNRWCCRHAGGVATSSVVGRLKAGVTPAEAEADLTRIFQSLAIRFPTDYDRPRPVVTPLRDYCAWTGEDAAVPALGGGCAAAVDCLREHREPAADSRQRT